MTGDVMITVAGKPVADAGDVRKAIRSAPAGKKVAVEVMRNKSKRTLHLEPRRREDETGTLRGRRINSPRVKRL